MPESKLPPPRYRIVERKGRLIVTDTWAGGRPPQPGAVLGARDAPRSTGRAKGHIDLLVMIACRGASDAAGRPILSTHAYYDERGPRDIMLGARGARRLRRALTGAVAVIGIMLLLVWAVPDLVIPAFILFGLGLSGANTVARAHITRWLDRLEAENTA
ncbi:MAG: hypothetical protein V4472_27970 [Pseudomonadota bacterium]